MTRKFFIGLISCFLLLTAFSVLPDQIYAQTDKKRVDQANKLIAEGDAFFKQKNYRSAIEKYDEATKIAPNYPLGYYSKGYMHYSLAEYDKAVGLFNVALKHGYKPMDIYEVRWKSHFMNGDYDSALGDAQAAIRLVPNNPYFYLALGQIYHEKGAFTEAIAAYQRSIELKTQDKDVNYHLAKSYNKIGDLEQQERAAREALKNGTRFAGESWNLIGLSLQSRKRYEEAIDAYERALIANPEMYEVYNFLAEAYRNLSRFNEAIATTRKGLKYFPNDGVLYTSLSWFYSLADKHNEAIAAAQQAIKFAPDQYMGYTNLCRAYNDAKFYPQAVKACTDALRLKPGDGESNFYLARAYDLQQQPDVATPYYKKAVIGLIQFTKENPDYSDGFYLLGNAYFADGKPAEAIEAYKKSLELSPRFAKARYNLGFLYHQQGDRTAARQQYNELLKIDPALAERLLQAISK